MKEQLRLMQKEDKLQLKLCEKYSSIHTLHNSNFLVHPKKRVMIQKYHLALSMNSLLSKSEYL